MHEKNYFIKLKELILMKKFNYYELWLNAHKMHFYEMHKWYAKLNLQIFSQKMLLDIAYSSYSIFKLKLQNIKECYSKIVSR